MRKLGEQKFVESFFEIFGRYLKFEPFCHA
jgi:hypothetical protein